MPYAEAYVPDLTVISWMGTRREQAPALLVILKLLTLPNREPPPYSCFQHIYGTPSGDDADDVFSLPLEGKVGDSLANRSDEVYSSTYHKLKKH